MNTDSARKGSCTIESARDAASPASLLVWNMRTESKVAARKAQSTDRSIKTLGRVLYAAREKTRQRDIIAAPVYMLSIEASVMAFLAICASVIFLKTGQASEIPHGFALLVVTRCTMHHCA